MDKECSKTEQINTTNNVSPTTSEEEYSRLTDIGGKEEYDVLRQATGTLPMDEVYAELEKVHTIESSMHMCMQGLGVFSIKH